MILAPGVQNTTDLRSRKAAFNNGLSQWSSDGAGEKRNDFTIDGVANVAADRVAYSPPSAAVEEFKIQTATYDAAVGNAMGASVNLVTKSGTNSLRGQVYEWFRGAKLDAPQLLRQEGRPAEARLQGQPLRRRGRRARSRAAGRSTSPTSRPIRSRCRTPVTLTVPTAKMRNGDFSELLALGPQYQIYDPATTRPHPTQAGRFIRDPFPGNIIPPSRINPVAQKHPRVLPAAESGGHVRRRQQLHQSDGGRLRDLLHGDDARRSQPVGSAPHLRPLQLGLLGRGEGRSLRQRRDRHLPQPQEPRVRDRRCLHVQEQPAAERARRVHAAAVPGAPAQPGLRPGVARLLAIRWSSLVPADLATFPNVTFDGYQAFSPWESGDGFFTTDVYNVTGSADLAGRQSQHEVRHRVPPLRRALQPLPDRGVADDRASAIPGPAVRWTTPPPRRAARTSRRSCSALPTGGSMSRAAEYTERSGVIGLYAHNDWRVRNNLTLNLGLRWEIEDPLTEQDDRMISGFDFDTPLPIADAVARQLRAQSDRRGAGRRISRCAAACSIRTPAGRKAAWERNLLELHAARRLLVAARNRRPRCAAATGCSTTCSGRTASARTRPAIRAADRADAVARQRPDVRRDARQSVSRTACSSRSAAASA